MRHKEQIILKEAQLRRSYVCVDTFINAANELYWELFKPIDTQDKTNDNQT